jgi:hypothetical protein
MSGLSFFDALGVRGVDRKPLIIAELTGKPSEFRHKKYRLRNATDDGIE